MTTLSGTGTLLSWDGSNWVTTKQSVSYGSTTPGYIASGYAYVNTTTSELKRWNGSVMEVLLRGQRDVVSLNPVLYVRTTGNDSNDGTTTGNAMKTIQAAINRLYTFDYNDQFQPTIDIGSGTFAPFTVNGKPNGLRDDLPLIIKGTGTNSANWPTIEITSASARDAARATNNSSIQLEKIKFSANSTMQNGTTSLYCIKAETSSIVKIKDIVFGNLGPSSTWSNTKQTNHIAIYNGSIVIVNGDYSITGNATFHLQLYPGSEIFVDPPSGIPITINSSSAYTVDTFAVCTGGTIQLITKTGGSFVTNTIFQNSGNVTVLSNRKLWLRYGGRALTSDGFPGTTVDFNGPTLSPGGYPIELP
jgi:hypothetical protein